VQYHARPSPLRSREAAAPTRQQQTGAIGLCSMAALVALCYVIAKPRAKRVCVCARLQSSRRRLPVYKPRVLPRGVYHEASIERRQQRRRGEAFDGAQKQCVIGYARAAQCCCARARSALQQERIRRYYAEIMRQQRQRYVLLRYTIVLFGAFTRLPTSPFQERMLPPPLDAGAVHLCLLHSDTSKNI